MIYAVHILKGQYVKIGFCAKDAKSRIAQLQTGSPFEIRKLFVVDGTLKQEKHIHYLLIDAFRRGGIKSMPPNEWYPGDSKFFVGLLFNLKNSVGMALSYLEEFAPKDTDVEIRNKKRLEKFAKYNTNPDAIFKERTLPPPQVPVWPESVKRIHGRDSKLVTFLHQK